LRRTPAARCKDCPASAPQQPLRRSVSAGARWPASRCPAPSPTAPDLRAVG
jgi:hypothetical protein